MKLHLPKVLYAVMLAAITANGTHAEDTTSVKYEKPTISEKHTVLQWTNAAEGDSSFSTAGNWIIAGGSEVLTGVYSQQIDGDCYEQHGGNRQWYQFKGTELSVPTSNMKIETVGSGIIVAGNGTNVSLTNTMWLGDIIVEQGATLTLTMGAGYMKAVSTDANSTDDATVYVDGSLTVKGLNLCIRNNWNAQDQNWYIGLNGTVTLDGKVSIDTNSNNADKHQWNIQKQTDATVEAGPIVHYEGSGLVNREKPALQDLTIIKTSNGATLSAGDANVYVLNASGADISNYYTKSIDSDGDLVMTAAKDAYKALDLTWDGGASGTWSQAGTGWQKNDSTQTSFLNGDSVTFGSTAAATSVAVDNAGVSVNNMTVNGDYKFTGGTLGVTGALTVQDGGKADIANLTMESGSSIAITKGELTLNNDLDAATQGVKSITMGGSDQKGALKLASGVELTYDGVTYRGTADGSELSSTTAKDVSVWYEDVTLKNLEIDFSEGRNIKSKLEGSTINAKDKSTVRFWKEQTNVKSVNVEYGGNLNADGYAVTVTGDSLIEGNAVASLTKEQDGKFILQGTTTVKGKGNLHSSTDSVSIQAKTTAAKAAGGATLKNVTVSTTSIAGESATEHGSISDGAVTLKNSAKVSNVDFENTDINLADASTITMQDVVFGAGTTVTGTGTVNATGSNTVVLTETAVIADKVAFDSETGVTLTYAGLSGVDFAGTTALTLQFTHDFIVALQKEVLSNYTDTLTIVFDGASNLAESATLSASALTGYPAMATPSATWVDGNTVQIKFADFDAIPEPATATLSLLALAGLAARRRRKH